MPAPGIVLERPGWGQRSLALAGAIFALAIATCAAAALLSSLYSSLAFDLLRKPAGRSGGDHAAQRAVALAPWRAEAHARHADARMLMMDAAGAAAAIDRRLRWAPGDPQAWLQRASLMRQTGRFDETLLGAYRMALQRAPQSPSLHYLIALHALDDWQAGDKPLREIWLASTARVLRRGQRYFMLQVIRRHRDASFCAYAADELPQARSWCVAIAKYRAACNSPQLKPEEAKWCVDAGLSPPQHHAY